MVAVTNWQKNYMFNINFKLKAYTKYMRSTQILTASGSLNTVYDVMYFALAAAQKI